MDDAGLTERDRVKARLATNELRYAEALEAGDHQRAFASAVQTVMDETVLMLLDEGYSGGGADQATSAADLAFRLSASCAATLEARGEPDEKLEAAKNALGFLGELQTELQRPGPVDADRLARALLLALNLGSHGVLLSLAAKGLWDEFAKAKWTAERLVQGARNKKTPWRDGFRPVAAAYCDGKTKVSLGELVQLARKWAEREKAEGRNPGLPATDDGVEKGLRAMEKAGALVIPGRKGGD